MRIGGGVDGRGCGEEGAWVALTAVRVGVEYGWVWDVMGGYRCRRGIVWEDGREGRDGLLAGRRLPAEGLADPLQIKHREMVRLRLVQLVPCRLAPAPSPTVTPALALASSLPTRHPPIHASRHALAPHLM